MSNILDFDSGAGRIIAENMLTCYNSGVGFDAMMPHAGKKGKGLYANSAGKAVVNPLSRKFAMHANAEIFPTEAITELYGRIETQRRKKPNVFNTIKGRGLTTGLGDINSTLGAKLFKYKTRNQTFNSKIGMEPNQGILNDASLKKDFLVPTPIVSNGFTCTMRDKASAMRGVYGTGTWSIDLIAENLRDCVEQLEDNREQMMFNGNINGATDFEYAGQKVYGILTHPGKKTDTHTTLATATGKQIVDKILAQIQTMQDDDFDGDFSLIIPRKYRYVLNQDYKATEASSTITTRQRLEEIDELKEIIISPFVDDDKYVLMLMESKTVEIIDGLDMMPITWPFMNNLGENHLMLDMQIPLIKSQYDGKTGILVSTEA